MIHWLVATLAYAEPVSTEPDGGLSAAEFEQLMAGQSLPSRESKPSSHGSEQTGMRTEAPSPFDGLPWWPLVACGAGAIVLWWTRRKLAAGLNPDPGSELRVVGRTQLGPQAGLAVVEVRDRNGTWRRLVIGTGDHSPQLVADLGEPQFGLLGEDEDSTVEEVEVVAGRSRAGAPPDLPGDFDHYEPLPSPSEAGLPPLPADPGSGRALVHEVLGERRRRTKRPSSFGTFA